ncbi:xanthine dehydrogenase family protein molybdopterin-binding subunit [Novosphingobium cyanobacteriorum]|uniref:Molybdopterin-dependent oxidoreductase n=1 Tax=Novosphingobium cyanobacteriorum TaxID=3024215 RepID=A0ABT6CNB5_9SPHN|nr:molybdopterin cofactor-binding domain-containing protein [Novosphingobium cyanobacteriorum]MDF8334728.1 molybdopterin-dependent oxidoreductase [Novosphingobium cyanobacteriorum]
MDLTLNASRREMLAGSALLGGALLVPLTACAATGSPGKGGLAANTWLAVTPDGKIALALPKTEMGQGILTAITMIAAEELAVAPEAVQVTIAEGDAARFAPLSQGTGGSTSIREVWQPLREAAAKARAALLQAAATQWKAPVADCVAHDGAVLHKPSGKVLTFAALVPVAAAAPLPKDAPLLSPTEFKVLGKAQRRLDGAAKARGTAEYGIDVIVPGMKFAAIAECPIFGGKLAGLDEAAAKAVPGVDAVIRDDDALMIVAGNTWAARQALIAADPKWDAPPAAKGAQQAAIVGTVAAGLNQPGTVAINADPKVALPAATRTITAEYHQSFLAHATMEPSNCVAQVKDGACEIWTGSQIPSDAREAAAKALGFPLEKVTFHNRLMGGGFGRRLEPDMVVRAVGLARRVPWPVKLTWAREQDMTHDFFRPAYADRFTVGVDAAGRPVSWTHKIAGSSIMARLMGPAFKGVDEDVVDGLNAPLYDGFPRTVTFQQVESSVPTGWWRGVGPLRTAFAVECMVDELANAANIDPIGYRLQLTSDPRARAVLEAVRKQSGWDDKRTPNSGLGVAVIHNWDTYMAAVADVSVGADRQIRINRVTVAVDCGQVVNPSGIRAQIDSGVIFGGSAALWGEITIAGGAVEQSNFHDYRVMRMAECPVIETMIIDSHEKPGGMGEPPCAVIGPALANALHALTGKRVRSLPLQKGFEALA